jgi:acetyl esterase/lipase
MHGKPAISQEVDIADDSVAALSSRSGTDLMRTTLLLLAVLLLCGCQRSFFAAINAGTSAASRSVQYGPEPEQRLDIYPAQAAAPAATVVFLYGGRWQTGRRQDYRFVGEALAARGVLTLIADYRQFDQVRFPTFVEDAALATQWAHDHASELGGDPERLFLMGHSAGAHIGALLATDAGYLADVGLAPRDLRGFIGIAGPYDFLPLTEHDLQQIFGPESRWAASQPVNFVDGDEPPMLLLHGSDDKLVWPRNSASLQRRLQSIEAEVDYRVYPDLGHIRILSAFRFESLAPTLHDSVEYIQRQN